MAPGTTPYPKKCPFPTPKGGASLSVPGFCTDLQQNRLFEVLSVYLRGYKAIFLEILQAYLCKGFGSGIDIVMLIKVSDT